MEPNEAETSFPSGTSPEPKRRWTIDRILILVLAVAFAAYVISQAIPNWRGEGDPVALRIGTREIPWYGIILMCGALAGALVGEWEARRRGLDPEHTWNILLWGLVLGVTVSRLWYVLGNVPYYFSDPLRIVGIENGRFVGLRGLTIHGALAGAVVAVILYTWRQKLNFWTWIDVGAPGFVMGQAVGRWGNFFNQEAYGWRTRLPWGIRIVREFRIDAFSAVGNYLPEYSKLVPGSPTCDQVGLACYRNMDFYPFESTLFHPTFLYEHLLNLSICLLLLYISGRFRKRLVPGEIFFLYGMLYAIVRFGVEYLRVDSLYLGPYPAGQVVSVGLLLLCGAFILVRRLVYRNRRQQTELAESL
jgi:phosphatidylglycerol:prolipoprotein diacylglycerol transferase